VIRDRLRVEARRLTGPLVVMQLRGAKRRVLAELYVGRGATLRLSSPPGGLRGGSLDVDTGIAAGAGADPRLVELRVAANRLLIGVDGRVVFRLGHIQPLRRDAAVTVRIGIVRHEGTASEQLIRAVHDELVVATS
jgi:hypothetical protein